MLQIGIWLRYIYWYIGFLAVNTEKYLYLDYIGDLSLALDPHPAPETPTATESLELSTMEEDEGQPPTPTRLPPEGVLQDVTNRALPSLKDHLKDKDQAKGKGAGTCVTHIKNMGTVLYTP